MALDEATYKKNFVDSKLITEEDFVRAQSESGNSGKPLETSFFNLEILNNDQIGKAMSKIFNVPFVNVLEIAIDESAMNLIPKVVVEKQMVLPYGIKDGKLQIAMVDPQNIETLDFIEKKAGMPLEVSYTTPDLFQDALRSFSQDTLAKINELSEKFDQLHQGESKSEEGKNETHAVEIVDLLLQYGYANNASDIHLEPKENSSLVRYRIDGVLHDVVKLSKLLDILVVSRIKILANLRTDEHFSAQDGKFRIHFEDKTVDVRVSILPVVEGEKIVMRVLSEKGHTYSIDSLGMRESDLKKVKAAALKPYGMILSTGPTGSGKTTSMYTLLKLLNSRDVNIQTIEDPIEYELDGINQVQVNPLTNLTFANGLRNIVRQDPDIIMVGEIRDSETANIAVSAAMTGHLVLSTLHTNDAATAIPRFFDFQVEPFLVASSVNVIIAQRLVRQICKHCSAEITIDSGKYKESLPKALFTKYFTKEKAKLYKGQGCSVCNKTGFIGRVGIFEVLEVNEKIRELIMQKSSADVIAKQAFNDGMISMLEDGIIKVFEGVSTIDEVLRNATA